MERPPGEGAAGVRRVSERRHVQEGPLRGRRSGEHQVSVDAAPEGPAGGAVLLLLHRWDCEQEAADVAALSCLKLTSVDKQK